MSRPNPHAVVMPRLAPNHGVAATNVSNARATRFYLKNGFLQRGDKIMIVGAETHRDHTFELPL